MGNALVAVAGLVVLLALFVATRPASVHLERSTTIAPPESAFERVNDFHQWAA